MPVWQVVVMLNLTLLVGLGVGYAGWGRKVAALDRDFATLCTGGGRAGEQQW
jgi:hypothetical protein